MQEINPVEWVERGEEQGRGEGEEGRWEVVSRMEWPGGGDYDRLLAL